MKPVESISFRSNPSYRVGSSSFGALQPAVISHSARGRSPSHIAASLAVSRSSSSDHRALSTSGARRVSPSRDARDNVQSKTRRPDITPNNTTNTLVELFESKNASKPSGSGTDPLYAAEVPQNVASPTPVRPRFATRPSSSATGPFHNQPNPHSSQGYMKPPFLYSTAQLDSGTGNAAVTAAKLASPSTANRTQVALQPAAGDPKPEPPPPRRRPHQQLPLAPQGQAHGAPKDTSYESPHISSSNSALESTPINLPWAGDASKDESPGAISIKDPGQFQGGVIQRGSSSQMPSVSSQVRQVSASNARTRETRPPHYRAESQMTVDSLANAIVASSLASSRAPSPTKPIPPPPRRHNRSYSLFRQHHTHDQLASRTPSPSKGMRQTMRGPPKSDDDDEYKRGSSNIIKKHPNKHHEGDRKRWRDQITERERKRYEGVWAANKGMYLAEDSQSAVCNLVVRDIWTRSRLSNTVLEEVWDLVDNESVGRLAKEEFVVGMWLIDQSLKGRKLPVKVSDSVWYSVRRLTGIKVPKNRR